MFYNISAILTFKGCPKKEEKATKNGHNKNKFSMLISDFLLTCIWNAVSTLFVCACVCVCVCASVYVCVVD